MSVGEEAVQFIVSGDLAQIEATMHPPHRPLETFPLCGGWLHHPSLLHVAAAFGNLTSMSFFARDIDVDARTDELFTPLHCAAANNHVAAVRFLVGRGATVDAAVRLFVRQTKVSLPG